MNIQPVDIIIRRYGGNHTIWLSEEAVRGCCEIGVEYLRCRIRPAFLKSVPESQRKESVLPDTGKSWRWAKIDGKFYYDLNRIPDRKPSHYRSKLPTSKEIMEMHEEKRGASEKAELEIRLCNAINNLYKDYMHCYSDFPFQQKKLSRACAALENAILWIEEKGINTKKQKFFIEYSELLKKHEVGYLPHNHRRLKEKIMEVINEEKAIIDLISLPRAENSNAKKLDDPELLSWIFQLRGMDKNYTNSFIKRKVDKMCEATGKRKPSGSWMDNCFAKHHTKFLTANQRFGEGSRHAYRYNGYIPIKNALFAGDCWQIDGSRFNIIEHKGRKDKDGKPRKEFLYIITVRDVHSGDILGTQYDLKEDRWAVFNALKMAAQTAGYLPYEMVFDKFPGHNTEEMKRFFEQLKQMGVNIEFSHKATAKARVERWFGVLQTVFMQESDYYYGEGIKSSRPFAHRNPKYLKRLRKQANADGWDFDAAWKEAHKIVENYRNTKLSEYSRKYRNIEQSPSEIHKDSEKPNTISIDKANYSLLFGLKKKKQISKFMINTEINKVEYNYKIEDYDIISKHKEVILSYDLEDLSTVQLFEQLQNGWLKHLGEAHELDGVQRYGKAKESEQMSIEEHRIASINKKRQEEFTELTSAVGCEVDMLMANLTNKEAAESAETRYLLENANAWQDRGEKRTQGKEAEETEFNMDELYNMM